MIERFSEEELEQIKIELGILPKKVKLDCKNKYWERLSTILKDKPFIGSVLNQDKGIFWCIALIVSCSLNNFAKRKYKTEHRDTWYIRPIISKDEEQEYYKMYDEIIDIMEKYNKKWDKD